MPFYFHLTEACKNNDLTKMQQLLESEELKNKAADLDNKLLTYGLELKHMAISEYLLDIPAIKTQLGISNSVFKQAIIKGQYDFIKTLLSIPEVLHCASLDNSMLIIAIEVENLTIVQLFLCYPEFLKTAANEADLILNKAYNYNYPNLDIVLVLFSQVLIMQQAQGQENWLINQACSLGHFTLAKEQLLKQFQINLTSPYQKHAIFNYRLFKASLSSNLKLVERLLIPETQQQNFFGLCLALSAASYQGYKAIVELLLPKVSSLYLDDAYWELILKACTAGGHTKIFRNILKLPQINKIAAINNNKALIKASSLGYSGIVNQLLKIPSVRLNANALNNSALINACSEGHLSTVQALLEIELVLADLQVTSDDAINLASENNHLPVVDYLLRFEAVQDQIIEGDLEALELACINGHVDLALRFLIEPKIIKNAANNQNKIFNMCLLEHKDSISREKIALRLLELEPVRNYIRHKTAYSELNDALEINYQQLFANLLADNEINSCAADYDNHLLKKAYMRSQWKMAKHLIQLPKVKELAKANPNKRLKF